MKLLKKCTAIKVLLWVALTCVGAHAWAGQVAGIVMQLSGPLMAKKADGKVKLLAIKSEVEQGDTLLTEKDTYALIKLIDNSEITLKPNTSFVIEQFSYAAEQPDGDHAIFSLLKGGLRSVTGLLGKRNKERFEMKTPAATIGIRGTTFVASYVTSPAAGLPTAPPSAGAALAPGLYVQVLDGLIHVTNPAGTSNFAAGQFGFTPNFQQPPVILPVNPGIKFAPPPSFSAPLPGPGSAAGGAKPATIDCVVR
ncbi:FecR domain-containing protein [Janthinobacterium sp. GW460P]|uniref:FecR family protein n=1 Tax=unclassified Janthinobacterium TaxID=2610881 RepID=UPI000A327495|nr:MULTISPECIES: FecR family protein [unclassified Janthinobacterium]MCC7701094.1 FecR domain-containing protein [Janthinobacterium sp. GW460P]MCC7706601.1 FecR domain-containing protein [Janthinobacterium sp. GW460W]